MDKAARTFFIPYDYNNKLLAGTRSACFGLPLSQLWHAGEDWGGARDTRVSAVADGRVVYSSKDPGTTRTYPGGVIIISHAVAGGEIVWSMYGHVEPTGIEVSAGGTVTKGQKIATGLVDQPGKPHLHWEMRKFSNGSGITNVAGASCSGIPGPG